MRILRHQLNKIRNPCAIINLTFKFPPSGYMGTLTGINLDKQEAEVAVAEDVAVVPLLSKDTC